MRGGLLLLALWWPVCAYATWSVAALDARSGEIVVASATCLPQRVFRLLPADGLRDIQAIVVPGVGVAVAQAAVDTSRRTQSLLHAQLDAGTEPSEIIERLRREPQAESRQYAIVDRAGRSAVFSGARTQPIALGVAASLPREEIHYSVQGNLLASPAVVLDAVSAFEAERGSLAERVMAAMEAADAAGGDRRCGCDTLPAPQAACVTRTALVAYLWVVHAPGPVEQSLLIDVTDENIAPHEDANPVRTLRMRFDRVNE